MAELTVTGPTGVATASGQQQLLGRQCAPYRFIDSDADGPAYLPGGFAAGDARAGAKEQGASAAGEGAAAALGIRRDVEAGGSGDRPMTVD
jgi:thioredoxin reductase